MLKVKKYICIVTVWSPHLDDRLGSDEARSEAYLRYGERALESLTTSGGESSGGVFDSVEKQTGAMWGHNE